MAQRFNLENYVTVNERVAEFWRKFPQGRITTEMLHIDLDEKSTRRMVVIKASVYTKEGQDPYSPTATGFAKEREGTDGANKTAFLENCETSAIGRALANLGLLVDKARPSQEEMRAVEMALEEHAQALTRIKELALKSGNEAIQKDIRSKWSELKDSPIAAFKKLAALEQLNTTEE